MVDSIAPPPDVSFAASNTTVDSETLTELVQPPLADKRGPKSFKKDEAEGGSEDADEASGDADEVDVKVIAEETTEEINRKLESDESIDEIVQSLPSDPDLSSDEETEKVKAVLKEVKETGAADVVVESGSSDKKTVIEHNNVTRRVQLHEDETSREVKVGGETILVVNENLTETEVKAEIEEHIIGKISTIAEGYGLSVMYEPFFQNLIALNAGYLADYYGMYGIPRLERHQVTELFHDELREQKQSFETREVLYERQPEPSDRRTK